MQKHDYSVGPRPPRRPPEYFVMEKHDYEVGPRPQPDKPAWKRVQIAEEEEQEEEDKAAWVPRQQEEERVGAALVPIPPADSPPAHMWT